MNDNSGEETRREKEANGSKGTWKVGPALEAHLRSLKDIGYDGVEDRLSKIREATFERMRAQKNNSISWARIVNRISGGRRNTEQATPTIADALVDYSSVPEATPALMRSPFSGRPMSSIVWHGDWKNTRFTLRFVNDTVEDGVSPYLTLTPLLEAGPNDDRNRLVRLRVPNNGSIDITVENGECVHENCTVIDDPGKVMESDRLELLLVDDDRKITLTRRQNT